MKINKQAKRDAKQLFHSCRVNGTLDDGRTRLAVQRVIELKPRSYLGILDHFQRLIRLDLERRSARIESATALAPEMQSSVQADLAKLYGAGLSFAFVQNPALIGGLRIKVGSDVYDGSVQGRLAALQESF